MEGKHMRMPDTGKKTQRKPFKFIPDELVPIYEHNLREHERLLKNPGAEPNWMTLPFDDKKLKEEQEKIIASVKRPERAASAS
ncbi:MAG: hypothetical protein KGH57_00350 [Candidatus Micrarchaeota archaeon]|nr:hypothetical protein [Candidatus Micrarchaeota archaeon]